MKKNKYIMGWGLACSLVGCHSNIKNHSEPSIQAQPAPATVVTQANANDITQRFIIRSDTQYPRSPDSIDDRPAAERLIEAQDAAINDYRDRNGDRSSIPILLNGDVTEYAHGWQWSYMRERLAAMAPTYYGLGNHDYQNNLWTNGSGCFNNGCATDSILNLIADVSHWNVKAFDKREEGDGDPFIQSYHGSMSYSKIIGDLTFIQLQNHYGYSARWTSFISLESKHFYIDPSLDWLETQLKAAETDGKHVVINMHRPPDDPMGSAADRLRFQSLVNNYHVVAIFSGHTHNVGKRRPVGNVPVFESGAAFNKSFLVAEYKKGVGQLTVRMAKNNVIGSSLAEVNTLETGPVPAPKVTSVTSGTLAFELVQPTYYRHRPFSHFEVSLEGGPFKPAENGTVLFYNLEAGKEHHYEVRATDTLGNPSPQPYKGVARTRADILAPINLCLFFRNGDDLAARWEPPVPGYRPVPYYFAVVLLDERDRIYEVIKGGQDFLTKPETSLLGRVLSKDPALLMKLKLGVAYESNIGRGPWLTLPLKWIYGSSEEITKAYCQNVRPQQLIKPK